MKMKPSETQIEAFLREVDCDFPTSLSQKQNLRDFSIKLSEKATLCCAWSRDEISAMVAGYTENLIDNIAYISVVATRSAFRGQGLAAKLIGDFLEICREKQVSAVHLYVVPSNTIAFRLYERLGFVRWDCPGEQRPGDIHMISYIESELK